MERNSKKNVVLLGFGETEDPLPEQPQHTRYRVFAGPCPECDCAGRKLLPQGSFLTIVCDDCGSEQNTGIAATQLPEVTYIYWCNSAKFASDEVVLGREDRQALETLAKEFADDYEIPRWAVIIVGGRCSSSELCVCYSCPYLKKSQ